MPAPAFLISTWEDGVFRVTSGTVSQELAGQSVRGLTPDRSGGMLAIVDSHILSRRAADGVWSEIMKSEHPLSCCATFGNIIFIGTDDANILRLDADNVAQRLAGFDDVEGRDTWYAGAAVINGQLMGPPLGLRSMTATCDGTLLVNVHVGGIPRSTDGGRTWQPTLDIDCDAHEVCAHPIHREIVAAASAVGLCLSRDGGITWEIEKRGLHALHCSGVAFGRTQIFVSASVDPFSPQGAVYRRPIDSDGPLQPLDGGMPAWTAGITDTHCIATRDAMVAIIDREGNIYLSQDDGLTWSHTPARVPSAPSGIYIL